MEEDKIIRESTYTDYDGSIWKRKLVVKQFEYVLTAQKYVIPKDPEKWGAQARYWDSVGYLIDTDGNLTRDVSKALIFKSEAIIAESEKQDGSFKHEWFFIDNYCNIEFSQSGLAIRAYPLLKAQEFLNSHPLPRKGISKITRGNVYAKYNGRCAYCGCDLELDEMQVDHIKAHMYGGGEDLLENYNPSCEVCNRVKSTNDLEDFKKDIRHCGEIHRKRKHPLMADSDKIAIKYNLTKEDHEITFFFENYKPTINVDILKKIK